MSVWRVALGRRFRIVAQMRKWISLAVLAMLACALARGAADEGMRASKPDVRKEVVAAIEAQLAAFRAGEVVKAYGYAAAELRAQKPLQMFTDIVRISYPEIWTNLRAECGLVRDNGTVATLLVHVFGKESNATYDYTLVKERAGWRIHGVLRHAPKRAEKL